MLSIQSICIRVIAVILAMGIHESAHGLVSYWFGDPTAKEEGRLTLNPLAHVDWAGLLCLLVFRFGWAKPVPVDPRYYKDPKTGMIWTAFAGPIANFSLALVSIILYYGCVKANVESTFVLSLLSSIAVLSIGFGVFNLLPIPPLDGSKILFAFLPLDKYIRFTQGSNVMMIVFILLISSGILDGPLMRMVSNSIDLFSHWAIVLWDL